MKKPIVGNYNWTPQQMARVNAQREARGQAPLASYNGADQSEEYNRYYDNIKKQSGGGIKKSQYDIDKEEESDIPIKDRIGKMSSDRAKQREAEQNAFREKFRKQQMLPKGIGGMRGAVSTPTISNSLSRMYA
jgi:hypothetical protein